MLLTCLVTEDVNRVRMAISRASAEGKTVRHASLVCTIGGKAKAFAYIARLVKLLTGAGRHLVKLAASSSTRKATQLANLGGIFLSSCWLALLLCMVCRRESGIDGGSTITVISCRGPAIGSRGP